MRYLKDSVVIQAERDIPLLRQARNVKFISHHQLFELMVFARLERSRESFNWRVQRLVKAGWLATLDGNFGVGSTVYRITREGIALLEYQGQFATVLHSNTRHLPHPSQVFHSLALNRIQLALARTGLLAGWLSEIEVASLNTISNAPYQKDYDAIVDVWSEGRKLRFAIEYEHTLKSYGKYERIRTALAAERQVGCILYLTSGTEVMLHLIAELQAVPKLLAFANARDFEQLTLETMVAVPQHRGGAYFRELLQ